MTSKSKKAKGQSRKKQTAAAAATTTPVAPTPRVIVIGAGMSGLACARELQQRRHDVLVVEARSRVGGRVWGAPILAVGNDSVVPSSSSNTTTTTTTTTTGSSCKNSTVTVDLGGALIHGTNGNPLSQLCVQLGIETTEHLSDCLLLDANGWPVDAKKDDRVSQLFNQTLEETFDQIQKLKNISVTTNELIPDADDASLPTNGNDQQTAETAATAVTTTTPSTTTPSTTAVDKDKDNFGALFDKIAIKQHGKLVETALWKWHQANLELSCGASFDALSYTWNDDEAYGYEGAHVALKQSWKTVVEALAEPLTIVHDCPVVAIEIIDDESVPVESAAGASKETTTTPQRMKREAQTTTASPSRKSQRLQGDTAATDVRRQRRSSRTPKKTQAFTVESHSVLSYDDVTLRYASKRKTPPNQPKVRVTLQNGSILQADAVVCTLPLGVLKSDTIRFTPPLPARKQKVISQLGCGLFNKCILSFSHVFWQDSDFLGMAGEDTPFLILNGHKITDKPILIFWFGGESAFDVDEDWQDKDLVEECMSVLRKISKKVPPEPLDYVVTRWGQDAYSRMTFSFVPPNVDGSAALEIMSEPLVSLNDGHQRPMVLFAGEHTTPFHPSTIHGAFLSGIREAYRLDLAIEPTLNGGLVFDTSYLYQKTFVLRKKKDAPTPSQSVIDGASGRARGSSASVKVEESSTSAAASNGHHRRRHTVMTLRKKKVAKHKHNGNSSNPMSPTRHRARASPAAEQQEVMEPSRKSHRSRTLRSPVPSMDNKDGLDKEEANAIENGHYHSAAATIPQDERTLRRLIHAYPNWNVIESKVLPLYGSTKKTAALKHRYQQLRRNAKRSDKSLLIDWKVGQVKPTVNGHKQQQHQSDATVNGARKSARKAAPKQVVDV